MPVDFVRTALGVNAVATSWDAYLDWRALRATATPLSSLPQDLQSLTTPEDYRKAQAYAADKKRFSITKRIVKDLAIDSLVIGSGAAGALWRFLATNNRGLFTAGSFWHSYAWGLGSDVFEGLVSLPFDAYSTFVVEQRHGFNKSTVATFVLDRIKYFALNALVVRPVFTALIRFVVARFGAAFPIYLCGGASVLIAAAMYLIPNVVMPLFNKFEALEDGEVRQRIERLAERVSFPLTRLFKMDGSKRSAHSNAFFFGFWNNKRIVLFDTLLDQMQPNEIEAVVAHELGHWHHGHMVKNIANIMGTILAFGFGASKTIFDPTLYSAFGLPAGTAAAPVVDAVVGFDLFSLVYWRPMSEALSIARSLWSRRCEFEADAFAARLGYAGPLRSGLVKLFKENAGTLAPDSLEAACRYSHPPLRERLAALARLPGGGAAAAADGKTKPE